MLNQNKSVIFAKVFLTIHLNFRTIKIFGQSKNSDDQNFRSNKNLGQSRITNNQKISDNQKFRTIENFVQSMISNFLDIRTVKFFEL